MQCIKGRRCVLFNLILSFGLMMLLCLRSLLSAMCQRRTWVEMWGCMFLSTGATDDDSCVAQGVRQKGVQLCTRSLPSGKLVVVFLHDFIWFDKWHKDVSFCSDSSGLALTSEDCEVWQIISHMRIIKKKCFNWNECEHQLRSESSSHSLLLSD